MSLYRCILLFIGVISGVLTGVYLLLPGVESSWHYVVFGILLGLYFLNYYSQIAARPVCHPDRKMGSKHKEAEAERIEKVERLSSGSKVVDDAKFRATSDIEKDSAACRLLSRTSHDEASIATISMSSGRLKVPSEARKAMKMLSETTACESEFVDGNFFCSSNKTRVQTKVELQDGMLDRLKDMVKQSTTPNEFTPVLQVDSWALLEPSDDQGVKSGVKLSRLPTDQLPVILHAEYAAGLLTITGLNLEDADIFASAESASCTLQLSVYRFIKATEPGSWSKPSFWKMFSDTPEDVAILPLRLESKDVKKVFIYAIKKVRLGEDGKSVEVMTKAVRIVDSFWNTVLRSWMPITVALIFTAYYIRGLLTIPYPTSLLENARHMRTKLLFVSFLFSAVPCSFRAVAEFVSGVAEFVKYRTEFLLGYLGRALLAFYYGFKGLKGPRLEFPKSEVARFRATPLRPTAAPPRRPAALAINSTAEVSSAKSIDDPDWEWPAYDKVVDKKGKVERRKRSNCIAADMVSPFEVTYCHKKEQVWPDVVQVGLNSTHLIKIVQKLLPQHGDLQCGLERPTVYGRDLFVVRDDLKNRINAPSACVDDLLESSREVGRDDGKSQLHMKHLMRFMDKEYRDVSIRLQRMAEEKCITWDMLWTFLPPGRKVVYNCDYSDEMLAAVVSKNSYTLTRNEWVFSIELDVWDYNGRNYQKCQIQREITKFDGERAFSSLAVRPIEMAGVPEVLEKDFLANGRRFYELALKSSHRFMSYSGPMFKIVDNRVGALQVVKENAEGRVMVDLANFAKMNPRKCMGQSVKPRVPSRRRSSVVEKEETQKVEKHTSGRVEVSDETLVFAPAIVYGFSFTLKEWGAFAISGFSEISFNSNAFDALVMDPDSKQLVYNLVSQYIATPMDPSQETQALDHISHKGEGCIFLCYGPPGTGKTLTAESVAESMHRPLWSLNITELGSNPSTLEKALLKVLEVSATWQAVVLLDEADCFLEKRSSAADLARNTMAGVFLRFLEYHRGVLFLTTNRIATFDNAFRSRISMFLHYPHLSVQQRERVWATLLERAGVEGVTADFVSQMAAEDLNGREIRNTIHTAQTLAKSTGQILDATHVSRMTRVLVSSLETLADTINKAEDVN